MKRQSVPAGQRLARGREMSEVSEYVGAPEDLAVTAISHCLWPVMVRGRDSALRLFGMTGGCVRGRATRRSGKSALSKYVRDGLAILAGRSAYRRRYYVYYAAQFRGQGTKGGIGRWAYTSEDETVAEAGPTKPASPACLPPPTAHHEQRRRLARPLASDRQHSPGISKADRSYCSRVP
jgi:hypothetical protein